LRIGREFDLIGSIRRGDPMTAATKGTVQPIPTGVHTVTPYLVVEGVPKLIDFLKQAFGARSGFAWRDPTAGWRTPK